VKVVKGDIKPTLQLSGQVVASKEVGLNFEVSGVLKEVYVEVGDKVKKGEKLAEIDDSELQKEVKMAKSNFDSARAKLSQIKERINHEIKIQEMQVENALAELNKAKEDLEDLQSDLKASQAEISAAEDKVEQAENQYELAQAQLEKMKATSYYDIEIQEEIVEQAEENYKEALANLEKAVLASPTSGTVIAINGEVGERTGGTGSSSASNAGASAFSSNGSNTVGSTSNGFIVLADLSSLQIEALVDQVDFPKVKEGQDVIITFDALPDEEFKGKVTEIDPNPSVEQNVVTYKIRISIVKPSPKIQIGMTADLEIDLGRKESVLLVPNLAVRSAKGKKYVRKIIDGVPTDVPVEVGLSDDENTEIVSGLFEGDEIVVDVFSGVSQGSQGGETQRPTGMGFFRR
jgi:multidrug efflux pump subunit AcrA (membrane-fusion protein)